jgi:hypothetical protein
VVGFSALLGSERSVVDVGGVWSGPAAARPGEGPPAGAKRLAFWLHFVGMPVQVGAATSPQAMLAPLQVEVRGAGERR